MSRKLKLTKITLQTENGKSISLSMDEARDLYNQLHELFGDRSITIQTSPVFIERDIWPRTLPYQPVWYSSQSADQDWASAKVESKSLSVTYYGDCE